MGVHGTTWARTGAAVEDCYRDLGNWLKGKRKEFDLGQADVAAIMKMSRPSVANIEAGRQRVAYHVVLEMQKRLTPEGVAEYRASIPDLTQEREDEIIRLARLIEARRMHTTPTPPAHIKDD